MTATHSERSYESYGREHRGRDGDFEEPEIASLTFGLLKQTFSHLFAIVETATWSSSVGIWTEQGEAKGRGKHDH